MGYTVYRSFLVGRDLNIHVGKAAVSYEHVRDGFGHGFRNTEQERTCVASDLDILKMDNLMNKCFHLDRVTNCKVVSGENLMAQHHLVIDFIL